MSRWVSKSSAPHKVLVVVIGEEVLQAAGPVRAPLQQAQRALWTAHVAVPRVLLDGSVGSSRTNEEVHALYAEAPERNTGRRPVILQKNTQKMLKGANRSVFNTSWL